MVYELTKTGENISVCINDVDPYGNDSSALHVLEEAIDYLLGLRADILSNMGELEGDGFYPKYYVYNNTTRHEDIDTFVIDPKNSEADIQAILTFIEKTKNRYLADSLQQWIDSHVNCQCKFPVRDYCPIVGYNLCCGCCPNSESCFLEGNKDLCNKVANDMFTTIEECDGEA